MERGAGCLLSLSPRVGPRAIRGRGAEREGRRVSGIRGDTAGRERFENTPALGLGLTGPRLVYKPEVSCLR